jgi:hypothetical protein
LKARASASCVSSKNLIRIPNDEQHLQPFHATSVTS